MKLPDFIIKWYGNRKVSEQILNDFNIKFENNRIIIPVYDIDGKFLFNKYRRNPAFDLNDNGPKYTYDKGGKVTLYCADKIKDEKRVLIVEGENDCMACWSHNLPAVTSTGGANSFQESWGELFKDKEVIIIYDNDNAGCMGALKTLLIIPHARVVILPKEAGTKDICDYYTKGGDLRDLIETSKHYIDVEKVRAERNELRAKWRTEDHVFHDIWLEWWDNQQEQNKQSKKTIEYDNEVKQAKSVLIEDIIPVGYDHKALCLWHTEKTPSMHIYDDNHFFCFACGKHGDVIDIVMEKEKVDFKSAVKWLNGNK